MSQSIDDKFIDYISQYKSPFEEEEVTQEELEFDGLMKFYRDSILQSIGTIESKNKIKLFWTDFIESCSYPQKEQFVKNCINEIIKKYKMSYLTQLCEFNQIDEIELGKLIDFIMFLCGTDDWVPFVSKSLSKLNPKYSLNSSQIKIFIDSDYDNFIQKIDSLKSCNELMKNYFKYCSSSEGRNSLFKIISTDYCGVLLSQYYQK